MDHHIYRATFRKDRDSLYTFENVDEAKEPVIIEIETYLKDLGHAIMYWPSLVKEIITLDDGTVMEKKWTSVSRIISPEEETEMKTI